ncbi:hypothetical protein EGI26_04730 [Lacihabitans sp. CCS-44]|uniref:LamG-like jellyroll fold domain-containing protein n=1 Tax=Lacihabitans sp. CCS-44 TaxID=2487331 RepID=UPI0020CE7D1A|nr:LamG-like jellyroll fold domain-containing protein [Lacihabitans sp. CCS-44]MCP9754467.1 hypothetical protein [Lacihabitans sp. CCS-44]
MKKLLFILFLPILLKAQFETFTQSNVDNFHLIGGYTYVQNTFSNGDQSNPFVVSGPYPQNSFTYVVSANGGVKNVNNSISTATVSTDITIDFKGNNVRRFGCRAIPVLFSNPIFGNFDEIRLTATSNHGNVQYQQGSVNNVFVGFRVTGENEYITKIVASFYGPFLNPSGVAAISLKNIVVGDDKKQNVALNFDGFDDYVEAPSAVGNFASNANFTVSCWIKPNVNQPSSAVNADENDIISKWAGLGTGSNNNYPFVIRYLNESRANISERGRILVGQWDGTNWPTITSSTAVNDGKWHHVAFVKSNSTLKLYIDGVQEGGDVSDIASNTTINTTPLQFGRRGNGQNYFRGEIDEVRVWIDAKSQSTIQTDMYCKNPNTTNLQAAYDFGNGSPNGNNALIDKVKDISTLLNSYDGTLSNGFNLTGDVSNFVTGQVKYVKLNGAFSGGNGSSWASPLIYLQDALVAKPCNDLFEVYVSAGLTEPDDRISIFGTETLPQEKDKGLIGISSINDVFNIPSGTQIYGGFAGNEKNINERDPKEIHGANQTILSGDLSHNDSQFLFTSNRLENSNDIVKIENSNYTIFDGFLIKGGNSTGLRVNNSYDIKINNCRFIDNYAFEGAMFLNTSSVNVSNSLMGGNGSSGVVNNVSSNNNSTFQNCLVTNNAGGGFTNQSSAIQPNNVNFINCTIASNLSIGMANITSNGNAHINANIKNTIIYHNGEGINSSGSGTFFNNPSYSFIQGVSSGYNMIDGTVYEPKFVNPISVSNLTTSGIGNYRLKWCSKAIDAGTADGINPLDLDQKGRAFNGAPDMGAYEFYGNTPNSQPDNHITGLINSSTYLGTANQTLTSDAKILAPAAVIDFNAANSITLNPGFEVRGIGQYFRAQIGGNVGCENN